MTIKLPALLLVLFLAHLVGFAVMGFKRREWYYLALVMTFGLLSASFATLLFAPQLQVADVALYGLFRFAAWAAGAVSISWTAGRLLRKGYRQR